MDKPVNVTFTCHTCSFFGILYLHFIYVRLSIKRPQCILYKIINISFCKTAMINIAWCFRPEMVVGWYHSHPGFGCWLSGVDINTQQSFEALSERAVAVVVDPIQSVKGKVVIDAFRLINPNMMVLGQEPRQTTSNLGHLHKPSIQVSHFDIYNVSIW